MSKHPDPSASYLYFRLAGHGPKIYAVKMGPKKPSAPAANDAVAAATSSTASVAVVVRPTTLQPAMRSTSQFKLPAQTPRQRLKDRADRRVYVLQRRRRRAAGGSRSHSRQQVSPGSAAAVHTATAASSSRL